MADERERARRLRRLPGGRRHVVKVLLSDAEHTQVTARTAALRVSVPRFFVESALTDGSRRTVSERRGLVAEFVGARGLVADVGVDLEQVRSAVDESGRVDPQLRHVLEVAARALARLDSAIAELVR